MSEQTKACNLTEMEVKSLIAAHMMQCLNAPTEQLNLDEKIERINYLNKRLKAFKEEAPSNNEAAQAVASTANAAGWGTSNG